MPSELEELKAEIEAELEAAAKDHAMEPNMLATFRASFKAGAQWMFKRSHTESPGGGTADSKSVRESSTLSDSAKLGRWCLDNRPSGVSPAYWMEFIERLAEYSRQEREG
jgi:hypothetical protein